MINIQLAILNKNQIVMTQSNCETAVMFVQINLQPVKNQVKIEKGAIISYNNSENKSLG